MAKFKVGKGMAQYLQCLDNLHEASPAIIGKAVFDGAGIVADAVKAETEALPVDNGYAGEGEMLSGPSTYQKNGLLESMGVAKMQTDGDYRNVKVGFDGYNGMKTKKYPKGQPNQMIANAVESGSSFRKKNPFINRAVRNSREKAERAMAAKVDEEISKIVKE
jgi:hypothetical protein